MFIMKVPKESSIVVCGIVRNAETGLKRNIPVINSICANFHDYKIVVFENNSKDRTKKILEAWHDSNHENVFILMEDYELEKVIPSYKEVKCNPFFSLWRIEKMANLRNKYLDFIDYKGWNPDYLMVVDLDISKIYEGGFFSSFTSSFEWDAVTANGYSYSPSFRKRYHDTYALVELGNEDIPQTENSIYGNGYVFRDLKKWVPVYSAFGGLSIYRYEKIKGLRYKAIPNYNSRVESRCEHYSIFRQMWSRGNLSVYINPQMVVKYQNITFGLIWKKLKMIICK